MSDMNRFPTFLEETFHDIQDQPLSELIAEETSGVPNHFGKVYSFRLPHSGLQVYSASALFIRASGNAADENAVIPDIRVA